jgi:hypothetical protein
MADWETATGNPQPLIRASNATTTALTNFRDLNGSTIMRFDR